MSEEQGQLEQDGLLGQADFSDPPPPGTACEVCRERGHFCPARGYVVDCAVCAPCAAGFACAQETAVQRVHDGLGYEAMEAERPAGECRSVPLSEATPPVEERSWISDDWKRVKAGLSHANLVAAVKERRVRERQVRVARVRKPKPLCVDGCGAEVGRRSKTGRCAACKAAARANKGATQPRRVRAMSEPVMCAGGCGRKLHHLTVKAGGRYAKGCSESGCKVEKRAGGGQAAAPKLTGIEATIAYTRKQLAALDVVEETIQADIDALELRIEALRSRRVKEREHRAVLRELLNRLDPPPRPAVAEKLELVEETAYEAEAA